MTNFQIHDLESAQGSAETILQQAKDKFGFVPNLMGGLAEAPVTAEAYLQLSDLVGKSSFTPTERHVIWFTINAFHNCTYCMAAHTAIAAGEKIDNAVVETARNVETYDAPGLEALRKFSLLMTEQRGWVSKTDVDEFLAAGFTKQQVLELVAFIAHKVISNYTNHLIDTPVDEPFSKFEWTAPQSV